MCHCSGQIGTDKILRTESVLPSINCDHRRLDLETFSIAAPSGTGTCPDYFQATHAATGSTQVLTSFYFLSQLSSPLYWCRALVAWCPRSCAGRTLGPTCT